jgi:hypothetical protein
VVARGGLGTAGKWGEREGGMEQSVSSC